jgi:hypothetical protein
MSPKIILASFAEEADLRAAVRVIRKRGWDIADVYTPYAIHALDRDLGWRRSYLPAACLLGGTAGAGLALWFQFWATAWDWPLNVGGRPWNSLPAFVPVIFECMVLFGGLSLVFAWLVRSRLYPGKPAVLPVAGVTDDRFAVALRDPGPATAPADIRQVLHDCHAVNLEERTEEMAP